MSRSNHRQPHSVFLYRDGRLIDSTTIPWSDPRFTKADDLLKKAYANLMDRETYGRRGDDNLPEWDAISVHFGWMKIFCDREGQPINDPTTDIMRITA